MTVAEYIADLQKLPQDLPVLVDADDYDGRYRFYLGADRPEVRTVWPHIKFADQYETERHHRDTKPTSVQAVILR